MNKTLLYFFLPLFIFSCSSKKEAPRPAVFSLQQIGKLATAQYLVTRLVKAQDNATWYKVGDRKLLISCTASVKAGVDFGALTPEQVTQNAKAIHVKLPPPQILSINIPPDGIKVAYTDVGLFRDPFTSAEINSIMQTAEKQIRQQVNQLNILASARSNASAFAMRFLATAGFTEVYVTFQ